MMTNNFYDHVITIIIDAICIAQNQISKKTHASLHCFKIRINYDDDRHDVSSQWFNQIQQLSLLYASLVLTAELKYNHFFTKMFTEIQHTSRCYADISIAYQSNVWCYETVRPICFYKLNIMISA